MNNEIRLDETFGTQIPERQKTPVMSEAEQRERYGFSASEVKRNQQPGETFTDAARRLAGERAEAELRAASKPKERPTQEQLWHASNDRDKKVRQHLKKWGLPLSAYVQEAQKMTARGELD